LKRYIFIDLETTGLDFTNDKIIEVGAIKVDESLNEIEKFQTLINPKKKLSQEIKVLTHGLSDEDLEKSPTIKEVKDKFLDFIKDYPLIAHNKEFEEKFLKREVDKNLKNEFLDTIDFFGIFTPFLSSLSLDNIIRHFKIRGENGEIHRALEDSIDTLKAVKIILEKINKEENFYFVAKRLLSYFKEKEFLWTSIIKNNIKNSLTKKDKLVEDKIDIEEETREKKDYVLNEKELLSFLKEPLEDRPQQKEYMRHIVKCLNSDSSIMIEGGTGIGKTIAYLLPCSIWSYNTDQITVVSTKTKTLQQQIIEKDIPKIKQITGLKNIKAFKVQGRNNYLCIRKLDRFFADINLFDDFETKYTKLFFYSVDKLSSLVDLTSIPTIVKRKYPYIESMMYALCSDHFSCPGKKCINYKDCHYFKMVKEAKKSQILIANHALVMNWPKHLPHGNKIIFDEAHNLEKEAWKARSRSVGFRELKDLAMLMGYQDKKKGLIHELEKNNCEISVIDEIKLNINKIANLSESIFINLFKIFEERINGFNKAPSYNKNALLYSRSNPKGENNFVSSKLWPNFLEDLICLSESLGKLKNIFKDIAENKILDEEYLMILDSINEKISDYIFISNEIKKASALDYDKKNLIFWASINIERKTWSLSAAFLNVGERLLKDTYIKYSSNIFTSATLDDPSKSNLKGLSFNDILSKYDNDIVSVGSPFDYENNAEIIFLKPGFNIWKTEEQHSVANTIINIASLLKGKILNLFTNKNRMENIYTRVSEFLSDKGYNVLKQGLGSDNIDIFSKENKSILFGTDRLAEGLDVKGKSLSCVLIERMPDMMQDIFFKAKFNDYLYNEGGSLNSFKLPKRILKLRQWSGRLIRGKEDKGVVIICDDWFNKQSVNVKNTIIRAFRPMKVKQIDVKDLLDYLKEKYKNWGYNI
jgi:ATP-dependent DNA helicase DinG